MFSLNFEYRVGGKRVSPDQFGGALEDELKRKMFDAITSRVESLQCPDHRESPRLKEQAPSGDNMNFTYSFCCEKLKELAEAALK